MTLKDDRLAAWARSGGNVAAFASFAPGDLRLRHLVLTEPLETDRPTLEMVVDALLRQSAGSVNVRTFRDPPTKLSPFDYGLTSTPDVLAILRARAAEGYHTIVNETIDINDGGVSGVLLGGVAEFAPGATPRAVEKTDPASLDAELALRMLSTVYGFDVDVTPDPQRRIEFSVHPNRVGFRRTHTLVWEVEATGPTTLTGTALWPNAFSRHLGDKVFGLLLAHLTGIRVPRTTVVPRLVAPFTFGTSTETAEWWIRTSPREPVHGKYTTLPGWTDPFALLQREDPIAGFRRSALASVLAQEAVEPRYSGAAESVLGADAVVEGVAGKGDRFMLGQEPAQPLPASVEADVRALLRPAEGRLGLVKAEWVHDGQGPWIVQLHRRGNGGVTVPLSSGSADHWLPFDPDDGLDRLRELVAEAPGRQAGIVVTRLVGVTSHVGDIIRQAGVPARIEEGWAGPL